MISFKGVKASGYGPYDFEVPGGKVAAIITSGTAESTLLTRVVSGLERPLEGVVEVMGKRIYDIISTELDEVLKNTGIVWRDGGIISNLKVWENVILPSAYHKGTTGHEVESLVSDICSTLEVPDPEAFMASSPGALSERDKVLVGVLRGMVMSPSLLIYDSVMKLAPAGYYEKLANVLMGFHRQGAPMRRTSVFISSSQKALDGLEADITIETKVD